MRLLRPDAWFESACEIDARWLEAEGVRALLLDLDNTVVARGEQRPPQGVVAWTAELRARGVRLALLSNTSRQRLADTGSLLGLPVVGGAMKPLTRGYRQALEALGARAQETAMVGDQSYTDVLGAHLAGMRAYMVAPLGSEDLTHTRLLRGIDRLATRGMRQGGKDTPPGSGDSRVRAGGRPRDTRDKESR